MKKDSFFIKTLVLTVSNIVTGILTFSYSIILSKEIGSQGMGLYQLIMPIYSMLLFISGGGITTTLSKISAEKKARGKMKELYETINVIVILEIIWSIFIIIVFSLTARFMANSMLKDIRTYYGILALSPAVIIISISSAYKGAYYGLQRVVEPALIDIAEKIVRISCMYFFVKLSKNLSIEYRVAAAVASLSCGEITSMLLFLFAYNRYKNKHPSYEKPQSSMKLALNVLKLSIPLGLNGIFSTIFNSIISVLIPQRLVTSGLSYEESLSLFGKLEGMALNIAFFPSIILSSFNILLIPSISEAVTFNRSEAISDRINAAFKVSSLTAFSSCALMFAIPYKLSVLFYKDIEVGNILYYIALTLPVFYISMTTYTILNGLGKQGKLFLNSTIISIIDIAILYFLLPIDFININAYAIDIVISSFIAIILNTAVIKKSLKFKFNWFEIIILPALISFFDYIITKKLLFYISNVPLIIILSYLLFFSVYFLFLPYKRKSSSLFRA